MVSGPDVIKELNLDDRLQAPRGQPDGAAHDVRLGEGRVVDPIAPELPLQAPRDLEHPALPLHLLEILLPARVGHVLAVHENAWVPRHLVFEAAVQQIHHRRGIPRELGVVFGVELLGGGVDVGRVDVEQRRLGLGLGRGERHVGHDLHFLVHLSLDGLDLGRGGDPLGDQALREREGAVTLGSLGAL